MHMEANSSGIRTLDVDYIHISHSEMDYPVDLIDFCPTKALQLYEINHQTAIPAIAKNNRLISEIHDAVTNIPTKHHLLLGDARKRLQDIANASVHLIVTSPPYWTLKKYIGHKDQMGEIKDYDEFVSQLAAVFKECHRVLAPGGRMVIVVGDVCVSRKSYGRHLVFPLHASIQDECRKLGFDNLAPIIWYKIANIKTEVQNGSSGYLGKPYEPGGVIKNDIEFILSQRKPGTYRSPSREQRILSTISDKDHKSWFTQIWTLKGASLRDHPAPFPLELAYRLIRMFSFVGDAILDPFGGTMVTNRAAMSCGRNSISIEVEPEYFSRFSLKTNKIVRSNRRCQNECVRTN